MAIFRMPRFLRRFFRRHMSPRSEDQVWSTRSKISIAYAIIAWNAGGFVLWQIFNKKNVSWPVEAGLTSPEEGNLRPAFHYAKVLGFQNASVYHVSGTSVSDRVDFQVDRNAPVTESFRILNPKPDVLGIDFAEEDMVDIEEDL